MLTLTSCPQCAVPAEVTDHFFLPSTDGPVAHLVVQCAAGHYFRMAADRLPAETREQIHDQERAPARPGHQQVG